MEYFSTLSFNITRDIMRVLICMYFQNSDTKGSILYYYFDINFEEC